MGEIRLRNVVVPAAAAPAGAGRSSAPRPGLATTRPCLALRNVRVNTPPASTRPHAGQAPTPSSPAELQYACVAAVADELSVHFMDTVHFLPQPSRELCSDVSATPAIRVGAVTNEDSSSKAARPIDRPEAPFVQARHPHCGPRSASSPVPLEPSFCFSSAGPACCDVHNRGTTPSRP